MCNFSCTYIQVADVMYDDGDGCSIGDLITVSTELHSASCVCDGHVLVVS